MSAYSGAFFLSYQRAIFPKSVRFEPLNVIETLKLLCEAKTKQNMQNLTNREYKVAEWWEDSESGLEFKLDNIWPLFSKRVKHSKSGNLPVFDSLLYLQLGNASTDVGRQ